MANGETRRNTEPDLQTFQADIEWADEQIAEGEMTPAEGQQFKREAFDILADTMGHTGPNPYAPQQ